MSSAAISLFSPLRLGPYDLPNRVVMAPLTRNRALDGNVPGPANALYYAQRASAGLIVSEATQVSQQGQGYPRTPGIHSREQVEGWRIVTEAVHAKGGRIFLQLWHVGAVSHSSFQPHGRLPVSPSGVVPIFGQAVTADWKSVPWETPLALSLDEIRSILDDYRRGAENAMAAGFDGVEVHGANGYLLEQFLLGRNNLRSDLYGGSFENRARLLFEVLDIAIDVWGADRTGVRLSPWGVAHGAETDTLELYTHVIGRLAEIHPAYLHLIEPHTMKDEPDPSASALSPLHAFRPLYPGIIVTAGGYNQASAAQAVRSGLADAVAFGRLFISNPDLPYRLKHEKALTPYDRGTFYGGNERGYTDYPTVV